VDGAAGDLVIADLTKTARSRVGLLLYAARVGVSDVPKLVHIPAVFRTGSFEVLKA
jgi:hypothetical protein